MKKIILLFLVVFKIFLLNSSQSLAESPKNYLKGKFYNSVKNHFLISSKDMKDERFAKTVILMLKNDENGSWGLVVNKPISSIPLSSLVDPSLINESKKELSEVNIPIFWGGPVDTSVIFILHSTEYQSSSTKKYGDVAISQDYEILINIAKNKGPKNSLVILGYAGWGDGQLEGEMERDMWVLSEVNISLIFQKDSNKKWYEAYKKSFIKL
tara:strand:+ start:76 stop:711 length:636 start_codon:yes stop_codon:yes gene_type:complete